MDFEWDPAKDRANQRKHGISFEEASTVFFDSFARIIEDVEHSTSTEERYVLLGRSYRQRLRVVCHCCRSEEERIRIFSARKADKLEQAQYTGFLP